MGYLLLALVLVVVLPLVSFLLGYIEIYLDYGVTVSAVILALWLLMDITRMKKR